MKAILRWINSIFLVAMLVTTSNAGTTEVEANTHNKELKIFGDFPCPSSLGNFFDPLTPLSNLLESQFGVTIPGFLNGQNVCKAACSSEARCRFNPTQVIVTKGRIKYRCNCIQTGRCGTLSVPFESSVITCVRDGLNACNCAGGQVARNCVLPLEPLFPTLIAPLAILSPIPLLDVHFCSCCTPQGGGKEIAIKENEISDEVLQNSTVLI